jgi:peptidyl-prolyl cis-trans isomerase B (cyclophilin B)
MQFFIVISPQHQLDSNFTVFGRVVSGMDVAADISTVPTDADNMARERIEITKITIREKTPTIQEMKTMTVTIETSLGDIKLEFLAELSPNAAREFIRYAQSGLYDGTTFFRVSQQYYMEAGSLAEWPQDSPNRKRFFSLWQIPLEKSDAKHVRGTLSMRGIDGMTSWYFFIISQDNPALDGRHVPIGRVIEGIQVVDKIAAAEVDGDRPKQRIEIKKIAIR